ncbi:MAG: acyl carrier protein [Candidatus Obscuribacterales bacterium]|nr:acyl carrier protein [Candidatus Obscuribacterales bacterium]
MSSKRDLVLDAIAKAAKVGKDTLNDATHLKDDLGLDSLDFVEMTIELEEKTGVTIPDDQFATVTTIGQLVALVDRFSK